MTLRVIDLTKECWDGKHLDRPVSRINRLVIHRIGESVGTNAIEIATAFRDTSTPQSPGRWTGGQVPYTFIVRRDGVCEQLLTLDDLGWHAKRWSKPGIGIACVGSFHLSDHPTVAQWETLCNLCSKLAWWLGVYELSGHTELAHSTSDPGKSCPGSNLDMNLLRMEVAHRLNDTTNLTRRCKETLLTSIGIAMRREVENDEPTLA